MAIKPKHSLQLGEIATVQTGPFGSQLHASDYKEHGTPIITVEHLGDNEILHQHLPLVGDSDRRRLVKYSLQAGDIVFTRVGAIDRRSYVSGREAGWLFSGRLLRVRPLPDVADGKFLSHLLGHHSAIQWIRNHAVGSTMACLNTSILSAVPLDLPTLVVQHRISEVLDTLDDAIRKTEQRIAKLKQVKQGLLSDLLTGGIDENGELRDSTRDPAQFKASSIGMIPKNWTIDRLEEVSSFVTSGSRGWAGYYSDSGPLFIRIGNLTREHINLRLESLIHVRPPRSGEGHRTRLEPGDLLISITADLGIIGVVPAGIGEAYVNQHIALVRIDSEKATSRWLGHYLAAVPGQKQIRKLNDSGAKAGLNLPMVRRLVVALPPLPEQNELASRLDSVDECIAGEYCYARKLHLIKQGLMDDLLVGRSGVTHLTGPA